MKKKLEQNQTVILLGKVAQVVGGKNPPQFCRHKYFFSKQNHLDFTNRMLQTNFLTEITIWVNKISCRLKYKNFQSKDFAESFPCRRNWLL